jgi:hypothetical protein
MRGAGTVLAAPAARAVSATAVSRGLAWPAVAVWSLAVLLVIEALVLILQMVRPVPPLPTPAVAVTAPEPDEPVAPPSPPDMPSVSASVSRTLFAPPAPPAAAAPGAAVTAAARQLATRLTLMGIVAGNPPQAIIEDAESKKTFFVSAGQPVVEGAVVEQVLDNRVILDAGGQKIELSL